MVCKRGKPVSVLQNILLVIYGLSDCFSSSGLNISEDRLTLAQKIVLFCLCPLLLYFILSLLFLYSYLL